MSRESKPSAPSAPSAPSYVYKVHDGKLYRAKVKKITATGTVFLETRPLCFGCAAMVHPQRAHFTAEAALAAARLHAQRAAADAAFALEQVSNLTPADAIDPKS